MSVPYLTVCILCAFLGIAFLYRFCLVSDGGGREYQIHTKNAGTCFDYHNADIYICND